MNKKIICLKIENQAQADFASKILTKVGLKKQISPHLIFQAIPSQFYLILKDDAFFFTYLETTRKYLILKSWGDFVFEFLKSYSVKCESPQDKQYFIDFFKLDDWGGRRTCDMYYSFARFNYSGGNRFFFESEGQNSLFPFDKTKILLDSIAQFDNITKNKNKDMKKATISISAQQAAIICAVFNNGSNVKAALQEQKAEFMIDENFEKNSGSIWDKCDNFLSKEDLGEYTRQRKHLFKPKIKEFEFSNSLVAKTDGENVQIGCQTKTINDWAKYTKVLVEAGVESVTIEGHTFTKGDGVEFLKWLKEIK